MIESVEKNVILWGLYNWYRRSRDPSNWWYSYIAIAIFLGIVIFFGFSFGFLAKDLEIVDVFIGMVVGVLVVGWIAYKQLMKGYL